MTIFPKNEKPKYIILIFSITIVLLINEFTLALLDKNPPLALKYIIAVRVLDLFLVICGIYSIKYNFYFIFKKLLDIQKNFLKIISGTISLIFFYFIFIVLLDVGIGFMGMGYPSHFTEEKFYRSPSPYDYFAPKPSVLDHNELGFRGEFNSQTSLDKKTISIGFFGGSTGYHGNPPIIDLIKKNLNEKSYDVVSYNFSSVSSSHTQHIHRLIKYITKYKFDFVIFFGGGNETHAYEVYDPRIGYPYNFFILSEVEPIGRFLLKYSNIIGEIDKHTSFISGLKNLQNRYKHSNPNFDIDIMERYDSDLNLAKDIVKKLVKPNFCSKTNFISITQPGNNQLFENTPAFKKLWNDLKIYSQKRERNDSSHLDLTSFSDELEFWDYMHFENESSRRKTANIITKFLLPQIENCK